MQGPAADPGVNQRALLELFSATSGHEACPGADISVAMLEIYNEDVHDLLADESARQLDVCALGPGQLPPGVQYTTICPEILLQILGLSMHYTGCSGA